MRRRNKVIESHDLRAAIKGPGVDTRTWADVAEVLGSSWRGDHGDHLCHISVMGEAPLVARIGSAVSGQFGGGAPKVLHDSDVVLVVFPRGDIGWGPVVVTVLHTAVTPVVPEAFNAEDDHSGDMVLATGEQKAIRLISRNNGTVEINVDGSGAIEITATGSTNISLKSESTITVNAPEVLLGDGGRPVSRVGDQVSGVVHVLCAAPASPALPDPGRTVPIPFTGKIVTGDPNVKA